MNKNILKMIEYPKQGIISKQILKDKTKELGLFCMAAGTEMGEHTTTREAVIYFIEGKGTFNLKGKKIEIKPGLIIIMEKNAKHSLSVKENTSFILNLIK